MVPVKCDSPAASQDVTARKAVWRKGCEQDSRQPEPGWNLLAVKPRMIHPSQNAVRGHKLKDLDGHSETRNWLFFLPGAYPLLFCCMGKAKLTTYVCAPK